MAVYQRKIGSDGIVLRTEFGIYEDVYLQVGKYQADNSIAIQVWNRDGPIATLTVCLCDRSLGENEAYIDMNNCPWAVDFIEQAGLGKKTGRIGHSGYCTYPVVKFDMQKVKESEAE